MKKKSTSIKKEDTKKEINLPESIINFLETTESKTSSIRKIINRYNRNVDGVMQALQALELKNQIQIKSNQQVKLISNSNKNNQSLQGKIDFNSSGNAYLIVDGVENDIFISKKNTGQALQGDIIEAIVSQKSNNRPEAKVTKVVQRKRSEFFVTLHLNQHICFGIADDPKITTDFFILNSKKFQLQEGMKALIRMMHWNASERKPSAEIIQIIKDEDTIDLMMKSILIDNGFSLEFTDESLAEAKSFLDQKPSSQLKHRRDMRDILTFTIDPIDAKDFDDAISFQILENDTIEVGVHIADVAHYVTPDSALDKEASQRATSVYLVDRVLPMLPENISNGLCSLRPNEDKLTFSAVFIFDKKYKIIEEWFGRTITHSNHRFTYEEAQEVLTNKEGVFANELLELNKIAYHLRDQKFKKGAIAFETQEVRFKLNEKNLPIDVYVKERQDAHLLIEDFMLLANRSVATVLAKQYKQGVYRNHDLPDETKLGDLALLALKFGYKMKLDSPQNISKSLNELTLNIKGKPEEPMLQNLALRAMAKAYYSTVNIGHYGLAFEYYSHFTSPIRRYPDVLTHRILQNYLDKKVVAGTEEIEKKCKHASVMERSAMEAERASQKIFEALFMKSKVGETFEGIISGIVSRGIYIQVMPFYCEGYIRVSDIDAFLGFSYDEENKMMVSNNGKIKYKIGQVVKVLVKKVDITKAQIDLEFV